LTIYKHAGYTFVQRNQIDHETVESVVISSKYQVVIPKAIRRQLDLKPGQRVSVIVKGRGLEIVPTPDVKSTRGMLEGADPGSYRDRTDRY